jgi:Fe-S-cluster containining protein
MEKEAVEKDSHRKLGTKRDGSCTMLKGGRCLGYEARPLVCRLFGVVPKMKCPWGCEPERWLTDEEGWALLAETARISEGS